jgi:hypothetical protein
MSSYLLRLCSLEEVRADAEIVTPAKQVEQSGIGVIDCTLIGHLVCPPVLPVTAVVFSGYFTLFVDLIRFSDFTWYRSRRISYRWLSAVN